MSSKKNQRDESHSFDGRLYVVQYVVIAVFVVLAIRFYTLQVGGHQNYEKAAENNRIRDIPLVAPRGAIYDRNGVLMVDNTPAFNIEVTPELMTTRAETIDALVENLAVERVQLTKEVNDPTRPKSLPILVKQNATAADKSWVSAHAYEHPEISVEQQPQRRYLYGKLASHVVGFIGEITDKQLKNSSGEYKSGDIVGQGGVERTYDHILRGKDGYRRVVVDSRGRPVREMGRVEPIKGQDILLTIDLDLQRVAEETFEKTGEHGVAIGENPQNGEILMMVSPPGFDPNVFAQHLIDPGDKDSLLEIINDPDKPMRNNAIQGRYPTGSTWKLIMSTAALEEGVITAKSSHLVCGGGIQIGNRFVHCGGNHGSPDIHQAIVHSCDGYFYRLGLKMGIDMIYDWASKFGITQPTGIDLPNEAPGIAKPEDWKRKVNPKAAEWKDFDTVSASIGQGWVWITPMQLLKAESGIMNGGVYCTPHVFKEARQTQVEQVKYYEDTPRDLKLSPETVQIVSYGAWGVVNEGGTAGGIGFPRELNVGGKTGTAQVAAKENVHTKAQKDHSWFISFAPLHTNDKPEVAVVVLTEHGGWGATASAPKAKVIDTAYFAKKQGQQIAPDLVASTEQSSTAKPDTVKPAGLTARVQSVRPKRTAVQ